MPWVKKSLDFSSQESTKAKKSARKDLFLFTLRVASIGIAYKVLLSLSLKPELSPPGKNQLLLLAVYQMFSPLLDSFSMSAEILHN